MNGILGRKIGMSQLFSENGDWVPVTIVEVGPCQVIRKKNQDLDGYESIVVGYEEAKEKHLNKPELGQFAKSGLQPKRHLAEFSAENIADWSVGKEYGADIFEGIQKVCVVGISKGRGFSGTVRRHNFTQGPRSHGSKNVREPGSLSAHSFPARVFPGKRMAGQYGNERVTVKNLVLVKIDSENNLLYIKGAVPGPKNGLVEVRKV